MSTSYSPNIVTDGLVMYLDAGNPKSYVGSGTSWNDLTGTNNGTLTNGPTYSTESKGGIVFDGTNDYVDCGNFSNNLNFATDYSFQFWINPQSSGNIIYRVNDSSLDGYQFAVYSTTGLLCGGQNQTSGFVAFIQNNVFTSNKTDNLAICVSAYNSSFNITRIYKNGTFIRQGYIAPTNTSTNCYIGGGPVNIGNPLTGKIFGMLAYNRTLSQQEVLQNYNSTKGRYNL